MTSVTARLLYCMVLSGVALALCACAAPPRSTRLQVEDFEDIAIEMAAKLRDSRFLAGRGPDSPRLTIAISKVENLSSDILSEGEKWYLVDRVFHSDAIDDLRETENIRFVIPAEKLRLLNRERSPDEQVAAERAPTHALTARLRSLARTAARDRTDFYDAEFTIVDLETGENVWMEAVAIKRIARGRSYY